MKERCIVITSYSETKIKSNIEINSGDFVLCADGGLEFAREEKIVPDIIIGDFDSCSLSTVVESTENDPAYSNTEINSEIPEKDDTDTLMCVKYGLEKGYTKFVIIGGLGGRFDHTIANIQTLSYILDNGGSGWILDGSNKVTMINDNSELVLYPEDSSYFSLYSYSEKCTGVSVINAKYPLEGAVLTQSFPIGTSNEFKNTDEPTTIKVKNGKLLIIKS